MEYLTGAYRDVGCRSRNEDSLGLRVLKRGSEGYLIAVIADGIGSLEDGDIAGGYVVERMLECMGDAIKSSRNGHLNRHFLKRTIQKSLYETTLRMNAYAIRRDIRMGSTLSMAVLNQRRYFLVQVGDSAIFKITNRKIKRITPIHTDENGRLTRCIGSFRYQNPSFKTGELRGSGGLLLSSDGFFRKTDEEEMKDFLNPTTLETEEQIEKHLSTMGNLLKRRGEKDNMSAIYIKIV